MNVGMSKQDDSTSDHDVLKRAFRQTVQERRSKARSYFLTRCDTANPHNLFWINTRIVVMIILLVISSSWLRNWQWKNHAMKYQCLCSTFPIEVDISPVRICRRTLHLLSKMNYFRSMNAAFTMLVCFRPKRWKFLRKTLSWTSSILELDASTFNCRKCWQIEYAGTRRPRATIS